MYVILCYNSADLGGELRLSTSALCEARLEWYSSGSDLGGMISGALATCREARCLLTYFCYWTAADTLCSKTYSKICCMSKRPRRTDDCLPRIVQYVPIKPSIVIQETWAQMCVCVVMVDVLCVAYYTSNTMCCVVYVVQ